ncbi:Membrane lipoprotein [Cocos nucifera]|uniref:Epidermal patterning factor-like protein n=1 Tax=Cocos nucifera TaxID=13894 RepID=A0A8K0ISU8_COCNU|nr:Membrane lipoprotein [Cocos nucifera]
MRKGTHIRVWATFLVTFLLLVSAMGESLGLAPEAETSSNGRRILREHKNQMMPQKQVDNDHLKGLFATGSSLPDCSHACGPCFPCKRVMVSFKCSIAESCPIVYRCMCNGKYYHVPSN